MSDLGLAFACPSCRKRSGLPRRTRSTRQHSPADRAPVASSIETSRADARDFELIITDDRSSDGTVDIAEAYARRDSRIRVFRNERNLGDYANRNHAASLATGEFLKFHDSDDVLYPPCLEIMVSLLSAAPSAGFALSSSVAWPGGPVPMLSSPRLSYQREFLGFGMFNAGPAGALFRTETFRALGGFEDHGAASDSIFWLGACARYSVLLLPADLFWYRVPRGGRCRARRSQGLRARAALSVAAAGVGGMPVDPRRGERRHDATWHFRPQSRSGALSVGANGPRPCRVCGTRDHTA